MEKDASIEVIVSSLENEVLTENTGSENYKAEDLIDDKLRHSNRVHLNDKYHHSRRDHNERENPRDSYKGNIYEYTPKVLLREVTGALKGVPVYKEVKDDSEISKIIEKNEPVEEKVDGFTEKIMTEYGLSSNQVDYALKQYKNHPLGRDEMTVFAAELYKHHLSRNDKKAMFLDIVHRADKILESLVNDNDGLVDKPMPRRRKTDVDIDQKALKNYLFPDTEGREELTNYLLSNTEYDEERHDERKDPIHRVGMTIKLEELPGEEDSKNVHLEFSEHRMKEHGFDAVLDDVKEIIGKGKKKIKHQR